MRSLTLRARLLLWSGVASAVTLLLVVVLVDVTFRAQIRQQLSLGLTFARQVAEGARSSQMSALIDEAAALALDTRLRAAVETGDAATVDQTLGEVLAQAAPAWAAVVSTDGSVLATTPGAPTAWIADADAIVAEALHFDTGDLWLVDGDVVEVAASAILFGAAPLAVLVTGRTLDVARVSALETAVGRPVAVLVGNRVVAGAEAAALGDQAARDLSDWDGAEEGAVDMVRLAGERFFAARTPLLTSSGSRLGDAVLLTSYDAELRPAVTLRAALIAIFFAGMVLTFGVSSVFSRGITVPVGRLLGETERLGQGDLERPIVPMRDDEIGRLAASFDHMRVSLRDARTDLIRAERLGAIGKAASAVAHDFTQPLSTIAGAIGLVRMDGDDPEVRERCFDAIEGELERLGRMKQEIVEFARGESTLDEAHVRIDSFLENTVSALRRQLLQDDIMLQVSYGYDGEWYIDSYRLGRVIENLVRNAAAAIRGSGTIEVRLDLVGEELVIEVEDDGGGIPEDRIEEIFEPFVSFGKKEGTGLGLAIARNVVRQHEGTIHVRSTPEGTCFTITLPRRVAPPTASPARPPAPELAEA